MQTTITIHISDSEFDLERTDSCHVISDEEDISVFLPIGIEFGIHLKDWISIKSSNPRNFISGYVNDHIRQSELETFIHLTIDNDKIILNLTETLEAEISVVDWLKAADKIVLEIVNA